FRQRETVFRIEDRRRQQFAERLGSEAPPQRVPSRHTTRLREGVGPLGVDLGGLRPLRVIGGRRVWRPAAGVESVYLSGLRLVDDGEEVAAQPVDIWVGEPKNSVGRAGGIDGVC